MEAEVAFSGDGHAQRPVAEHLYPHQLAARASDVVADYRLMDCLHLVEVELAGEHHHVGKLRVISQGLGVGDAELGGDMHLHPFRPGVEYRRHV